MARGASRANSEAPQGEASPKADFTAKVKTLGPAEIAKLVPKRLVKYIDIEDVLKNSVKVDIRYYAEEGDGEDGRGSSASYYEDQKQEFKDMVDSKIDMENARTNRTKAKDKDGNVWEIKETVRMTEDKINHDPKEWGQRTTSVLTVNGEKIGSWRRYRIVGG